MHDDSKKHIFILHHITRLLQLFVNFNPWRANNNKIELIRHDTLPCRLDCVNKSQLIDKSLQNRLHDLIQLTSRAR